MFYIAVTPLLDKDGKPIISEAKEKKTIK